MGHLGPIFTAGKTGAKFVAVDPGLGTEQADQQGLLAHFEREHPDYVLSYGGRVGRDVQSQGSLAEGGARRDDDQLAWLQARGHIVQLGEAGLNPRDALAAIKKHVDVAETRLDDIGDAQKAGLDLLLGNLEHLTLGGVNQGLRVFGTLQAAGDDIVGDIDEAPDDGFAADDPAVLRHIGSGPEGNAIGQGGDIGSAARAVQQSLARNLFRECHQVNRRGLLGKLDHLLEDDAMSFHVEVVLAEQLHGRHQPRVVNQDGPQQSALGFQVLGIGDFAGGTGRHGWERLFQANVAGRADYTNRAGEGI